MSKIKIIEPKTFQGRVTGHLIELDNGTKGYLDDKGSDKVNVGDEVECIITTKNNQKGEPYKLLTLKKSLVRAQPPSPIQTWTTPTDKPVNLGVDSWQKMKYDTRIPIAKIIMDAMIAGKLETSMEEFSTWFNAITAELDASINEIQGH